MSEQKKVWVEELPESCDECKYCTQFTDGMGCMVAQELRPMDEQDNYMQAACPLQSIKDHDRELVEKVIKEVEENFTKYLPLKNRIGAWFYGRLNEILKKYQKEFEK